MGPLVGAMENKGFTGTLSLASEASGLAHPRSPARPSISGGSPCAHSLILSIIAIQRVHERTQPTASTPGISERARRGNSSRQRTFGRQAQIGRTAKHLHRHFHLHRASAGVFELLRSDRNPDSRKRSVPSLRSRRFKRPVPKLCRRLAFLPVLTCRYCFV